MEIWPFLRETEEKVYLKTCNGAWARFVNILKGVIEENNIKLKKRKFKVDGRNLAWGGRHMGKNMD